MSRYISGEIGRGTSRKKFSVGYLLIIIFVFIFVVRAISVINKNNERGGFAYVQLLNFSNPLVQTQAYDKDIYAENKLSVKRVIAEALGLESISTYGIIGSEVTLFSNASGNSGNSSGVLSFLKPYQLNDNSVAKLTDEEVAELNKVSAAYNPDLKKTLDNSKPEVLIYHTHTTEAYGLGNVNDTTDENGNVVGVGDIVAKELEENYGISVIHDKTVHNSSYNESYIRSGETLQKYLDQYGDFKLIIDLHRDSVGKELATVSLNGQSLARMMFVTAQNSPKYQTNKALADKFAAKADELFPGLLRNIPVYDYESGQHYGFNSGMSDNFLLIEDGSSTNTAQEARLTGKYIARLIAEYINGGN